jgi:hypothetical protein
MLATIALLLAGAFIGAAMTIIVLGWLYAESFDE